MAPLFDLFADAIQCREFLKMLVFEDLVSGQVQEFVLIFELSYQNQIDALA